MNRNIKFSPVMTVLSVLLTGCGLWFNFQYVFTKGTQIGINEEKYYRNIFIEDSYNKGLIKGIKYGILMKGQGEYIASLIKKDQDDVFTKAFFEGYSKGLGTGVAERWGRCKQAQPNTDTSAPESNSLFKEDN